MNDLLAALVAASKAGFDAPRCGWCIPDDAPEGNEWSQGSRQRCVHCLTTGLDASYPFGLIGRAMGWLWGQKRNVTDDEYPNISAAIRDAETGCGMRGLKLVDDYVVKRHDGTPTGLATALLRLVARVGGP